MEKKGMLYKRTFSAAASALMVLSACAPMSVFATEFDVAEETSDFDVVNESATLVTLKTNFEEKRSDVSKAFADAARAINYSQGINAAKNIMDQLPATLNEYELTVKTTLEGMITNQPGRPAYGKKGDPVQITGNVQLNIELGDLLGLTGDSKTFLNNVVNGLDNLAAKNVFHSKNLLDENLVNGFIQVVVSLPKGPNSATFDGTSGYYSDDSLISEVSVSTSEDKSTAYVKLKLNPNRNVRDLVRALRGNGELIKVELPYSGSYTLMDNNKTPEMKATVTVANTELISATRFTDKKVVLKAAQNGYKPAGFDVLKAQNSVIKDEPVKPSKPSGTLTGGYPTSKPGNSTSTSSVRAMYRLYNPKTAEHFYTQSAEERDNLVRGGWNNEGIGWHAPTGSNTPVYRVFNPNSGDHHYTTNLEEYQTLTRIGWNAEGIGWYSASDKGAPIYRLYNKKIKVGSHHYTQNAAERDKLVNEGWVYEGIAWYAVK